ncbi:MAG TPA: nucleotidyltransferase family protein [Gemmatimonadales bacterium]|nr:nucleotidyltransferase family protein [Gemmatimonadales bacterium]
MLAAGRGARFGRDKLLVPLGGRPLLAHVLDVVRAARVARTLAGGCVVVPADRPALLDLVRAAELDPVVNRDPAAGLGESLRRGIAALAASAPAAEPAAAVILLGDQPGVRAEVLAELVGVWDRGRVAAVRPRYAAAPDEPGHPMLVDRRLWSHAARLSADVGFGPVLAALGIGVVTVNVPGRNPDVDTEADLGQLE